uniref:Uncharacterized protein n=1 Tax=Caenorhabditis japonica TaxID=281687 RepID=A0A2Q4SNF6_CAEJA
MKLIKFPQKNISQVLKMISKIQPCLLMMKSLKMVVYKDAVQLSGKPNLIRFCHGKLVELDKVPNMKFHT